MMASLKIREAKSFVCDHFKAMVDQGLEPRFLNLSLLSSITSSSHFIQYWERTVTASCFTHCVTVLFYFVGARQGIFSVDEPAV